MFVPQRTWIFCRALLAGLIGSCLIAYSTHGADPTDSNSRFGVGGANIGKRIGLRIKQAAQRIPDALTIEPRVKQAPDPLSLSTPSGPIDAELFTSAARLYERQGNLRKAEASYKSALKIDPNDLQALIGYTRLLDENGRFAEAARLYLHASKIYPNNGEVFNNFGMYYSRQNRFRDALFALSRAVELQPRNVLYRNNIATVLVEMNRMDEAYTHLAAVHGESVAYFNLGYLLQQQGETMLARTQFVRALGRDPNFAPARRMLEQMDRRDDGDRTPSATVPIVRIPAIRPTYPLRHRSADRLQATHSAPEPKELPEYLSRTPDELRGRSQEVQQNQDGPTNLQSTTATSSADDPYPLHIPRASSRASDSVGAVLPPSPDQRVEPVVTSLEPGGRPSVP